MKNFIVLMVFAIGMLLVMPPGNSVQAATADHTVSFVYPADHFVAPAIVHVQEFGSIVINQGYQVVQFTNGMMVKDPDLAMLYGLNYRTCLKYSGLQITSQKFTQNSGITNNIRIRSDCSEDLLLC